MTDLPRAQLGSYRLETLLGRGGMGSVYQAVDPRLRRRVAVKHLPPVAAGGEARRRRFRREALALARLSHPAIVQIFEWIEEPDGDWIVMERVEGSTVAQLLEQGPLPIPQVLEIGRWVAEGIGEAHDRGILHRDLKAENLILQPTGHAKILDFGLAKSFAEELGADFGDSEVSRSGLVLGTVRAMAPEQAQGLHLDGRSDLFSLGVLLYEMVAAVTPFRGRSKLETLQRILTHPHISLERVRRDTPPELARLVDRLLEKSPEQRPARAAEVAAELATIAATTKVAQLGTPARPTAPRSVVARPTAMGAEGATRDAETTWDGEDAPADPSPSRRAEGAGDTPVAREPAAAPGSPAAAPRRRPRVRKLANLGPLAIVATLTIAALVIAATWGVGWPGSQEDGASPDPFAALAPPAAEPDVHGLLLQGMAYLDRCDKPGNPDRAVGIFEAILDLDGASAPAHAGLALAYWCHYRYSRDPLRLDQAGEIARRAVELDDHLALARVALGKVEAEAGNADEALAELEVALQLSPGNADVFRGLGIARALRGETELAIEAFASAVAEDPGDLFSRGELGMLYFHRGRYDEAEAQFVASIDAFPDSVYGHRNLSAVYYMQGRLGEAAKVLQRALMITPDASLYSNLGTILYAQGLYLPAARAFEKALQHDGGNVYLYWANLADAYRQAQGQGEQAVRAYGQAIRLIEGKLEVQQSDLLRSRLALYSAKAGDCTRARGVLAAAGFAPQQASEHYRRAVTLEICGDRPAAVDALRSAMGAGFSTSEIAGDPELFDLRTDPAYQELIAETRSVGTEDQVPEIRPEN
ncbi:MAG: protein kinase [Holophagales bacterium]|nr:protein kinase [Holophagales bacterium]